jgi:hypothetical protein
MQVCEALIGPIEDIARIAGQKPKAAYRWRHRSVWRDAGDIPSARYMRTLLAHAAARQIPLTADHLIFGAGAEEIAALVAELKNAPHPRAAAQVAAE